MIGLLGSGILGGGAGVVTTLAKIVADSIDRRSKRKHELKMAPFHQKELEIEQAREEFIASNKLQIAELEQATSLAEMEVDDRTSARDNDACKYLKDVPDNAPKFVIFMMGLVDFCRGMTRPIVTWMLVIFICLQYAGVIKIPIEEEVIFIINEMAAACITFWFGGKIRLSK